MKKIYKFHIIMCVLLLLGFILNNVDEPSEIGVVNNFFLLLITFAYLIATLLGGFKKSTK
jgi:hypothetical protein